MPSHQHASSRLQDWPDAEGTADLTAVLNELQVPVAEKAELLGALAPLKAQIVQK